MVDNLEKLIERAIEEAERECFDDDEQGYDEEREQRRSEYDAYCAWYSDFHSR